MKPKITWITYDSFIDCDINIVKELKEHYSITWILIFPPFKSRFKKEDFKDDVSLKGVNIIYETIKFRLKKPITYLYWWNLSKFIKKTEPDIIYFNGDVSLFNLLLIWNMDKKKLILTIHEGLITTNNKKQLWMINMARRLTIPYIKYINCFSKSQASYFSQKFNDNKIFVIPLALKDFGNSKEQRTSDEIVFFNFGTILPKKNIDLLIEAACNIYDLGYRKFKIAIIGSCADWSYYEKKIRYPNLFISDIRSIDNSEIKDLFAKYHYLVLPYKVVSQSGPLKISFNYDIPVIVSDQIGFTQEVVDGVNGFIFETGDVKSLESVLMKIIDNHKDYESFRTKMALHTKMTYSNQIIATKYINMFNEVQQSNN